MYKSVLIVLFCLCSITFTIAQDLSHLKIRKVVIDAGHGGKDPGAISKNKRHQEKNITLSVALKLGSIIQRNHPDIEVIYTRDTDVFIPLISRTEIANNNKADLFISIHVNSSKSTKGNGSETFVMGNDKSKANFEVAKLENAVISLEGDNYKERYSGFDPDIPESYIIFSLLQNAHQEQSLFFADIVQKELSNNPIKRNRGIHQEGFLVLWQTTMPSVLIELGFISNPDDLKVLIDKKNHTIFAEKIYSAFATYKRQYEEINGSDKDNSNSNDYSKEYPKESEKIEREYYRIQILATSKSISVYDKEFKGVKNIDKIKDGKFYKYLVSMSETIEEAKIELARYKITFKDAFIVRIRGEQLSKVKL